MDNDPRLRAFLEALEVQEIDKLMTGSLGDFKALGKLMVSRIKGLNPFSDLTKGIEWVSGKCTTCEGEGRVEHGVSYAGKGYIPCKNCNGTGTITRPATIEEVVEQVIKSFEWEGGQLLENNGTLRLKQ